MRALRYGCLLCAAGLLPGVGGAVRAERLPVRVYTTADGLPRDQVPRIVCDREGFVWFLTSEGAARFDGERVRVLGPADGFPAGAVHDARQTRDGALWLATSRGLYRVARDRPREARAVRLPDPAGRERAYQVLFESPSGALFAGTDTGVARVEAGAEGGRVAFETLASGRPGDVVVRALAEDRGGALWAGTSHGLFRRDAAARWTLRQAGDVRALALDGAGALWITTEDGVRRQDPGTDEARVVLRAEDLGIGRLRDLLPGPDGAAWIAGCAGVAHGTLSPPRFRAFGPAEGWPDTITLRLARDGAGGVWAGTESAGAVRLAPAGLTTFDTRDGLPDARVSALLDDGSGAVLAVVGLRSARALARFDGRRFRGGPLRLPPGREDAGWGTHRVLLADREGDWWLATARGLARWRAPAGPDAPRTRVPDAVYAARDGLGAEDVFRLYEDRRGVLWIGTLDVGRPTLWTLDPGRRAFRGYGPADGAPPSAPTAFAEDRRGRLWIGFYDGGLARVAGDRLAYFPPGAGGPRGFVWDLLVDAVGTLWAGTSDEGLLRLEDDGGAGPPRFRSWTRASGLASDAVQCLAEDARGRIYAGTPRGVDRLDPATGDVAHFTTADGLAGSETLVAHRARDGSLWFGTLRGLSRLVPGDASRGPAPAVFIASVRVAGVERDVDPLGAHEVAGIELAADARQIEIGFGGLQLGGGGPLRFQYRVEGAGASWSAPSPDRAVHFANLAAGRYRVLVRAVGPGGAVSARPAAVSFAVAPPAWRRWYVLLGAALLGAAALVGAHRARTARLLGLERVRTRIATDLHDDLGATLSEIAISAELVRRRAGGADGELSPTLERIAGGAREMVDAMSDIVWSIDPHRDRFGDLCGRVRRFGGDLLGARGVEFRFRAPEALDELALGANLRRELLLVAKEALTNAARHSGAARVDAELRRAGRDVVLAVADDGAGFDPAAVEGRGNGLANLRRRAAAAGGACTIDSAPGRGTRVEVRVPLGRRL